ncbi:hypothetical protein P879_04263 [Paragonimus westermani]|uniref:Uncharacterized protein n=1 Tax=Paragonimus westermani TaxID=34504 RepID=A0A8T0DNT6_9TREM|nr:hypothetical protein P879_04263 [Paragonimus westermani]
MQRIIEEKRRQRTISVGSLDGMVITRDNELIAASQAPNYDRPLLSCSAINRISEAVARKIEVKMQQQLQPTTTVGQGNPIGGTGAPSKIGSRIGLSRSQLRVNLPLVVQEYIHSQLSLPFQQQNQLQPPPAYRQSTSFIGPLSTVSQPRPSSLTVRVCFFSVSFEFLSPQILIYSYSNQADRTSLSRDCNLIFYAWFNQVIHIVWLSASNC